MTAVSSVLLVTGGEDVMRRTFRECGRAYWSAEFALILEKHGWLDFQTAGPEVLEDIANVRDHAALVVAWLPEDAWQPRYVDTLRAYEGIVLLEGPFPPRVEDFLGIERSGVPVPGARGSLSFNPTARAYLDQRFGDPFPIGHRSSPDPSLQLAAGGDPNPVELAPRESVTRPRGFARDTYAGIEAEPFEQNVGRAAVSMVLAYRARFGGSERFFDDPVDDALALLACSRCLARLSTNGPLREAFVRLVREAAGSNRPPVRLVDERTALARTVWGVALVEVSEALNDTTFAERAKEIVRDVRAEWQQRRPPDPALTRWRALLALRLSRLAGSSGEHQMTAFVAPHGERGVPILDWLDRRVGIGHVNDGGPSPAWLESVATQLESGTGPLPQDLDGLALPDLMLTIAALREDRHLPAARRLWRALVEESYDPRQGLFVNANVVGGKLVSTKNFATGALAALGLVEAAGEIRIEDAPMNALAGYTAEQLLAWAAPPYVFQPYDRVGDSAVVTLELGAARLPAIWRRGNVIATAFQVLATLVHLHTVEPLAEPFTVFRSGDTIALEHLLLHLLGTALAEREPRVVQLAPWPWGVRYGLTIRHDVDRVLDEDQFAKLLTFEHDRGLAVSWFWLPDRLEPDQLATLEREPGHEVGLHAVRIDQKPRELENVGRAVAEPLVGEAIHGSGDAWLGHLSVRAALDAGLLYTELAPPVADTPYARYPVVHPDGRVDSERIVGITYNISIDGKLGVEPGSEGGPGLYRQLLNHPDLNLDRLENWVAALPDEQRVNWTCEQVARWWQATHDAQNLTIRHQPKPEEGVTRFEIASSHPVEDLELRMPCRAEEVNSVSVGDREAEWAELREPEYGGVRIRVRPTPGVPVAVEVRYDGASSRPD